MPDWLLTQTARVIADRTESVIPAEQVKVGEDSWIISGEFIRAVTILSGLPMVARASLLAHDYDYLYHYVLTRIQDLSRQAQLDEKELLNTLIEMVVIHEATTVDGMRERNIDIYCRLIGKIE